MTAMPAWLSLPIYRGDPFELSFSAEIDGVTQTVVADDALAQIRATTEDVDTLAVMTVTVVSNVITLTLTPDQTADLPLGDHAWDFQPAVDAETWLYGNVPVIGDVSRPT